MDKVSSARWLALPTLLLASRVAAGAPVLEADGSEFEVESSASVSTLAPRVAMDAAGRFLVVWQAWDLVGGNEWDVRFRAFDADGVAVAAASQVGVELDGWQSDAGIAASTDGDFLVTWSDSTESEPCMVQARVFDALGNPDGLPRRIDSTPLPACPIFPAPGTDNDGFVVAWFEDRLDKVAGVRLESPALDETAFSVPFAPLSTDGTFGQVAAAGLPDGRLVLAWSFYRWTYVPPDMEGDLGHVDGVLLGQDGAVDETWRANEGRDAGDPTGDGFLVDGDDALSVATDALGCFTVAHDSRVASYVYNVDEWVDGFSLGARVERFAGGTSEGSIQAAPSPGDAVVADLAATPGGNTVVAWQGDGVFVRAIDCHGMAVGEPIRLDEGGEFPPSSRVAVAVNESGDGVATWSREKDDGAAFTVIGRRFRLQGACALCGDADRSGRVTASDALGVLRAGIGLQACPLDRCDADVSGGLTAGDALRVLKHAVGALDQLSCHEG